MNTQPNILIVDDDKPLAQALQKALNKIKPRWVLLLAHSEAEAVALIHTHRLDAIITDWKLNEHNLGQNGVNVIRAATEDPQCVCLLISGYVQDFDRYRQAYENGAFDCIAKAERGVVLVKEIAVKLDYALQRREFFLRTTAYARHLDEKLKDHYSRAALTTMLHQRWLTVMFTDVRGFSAVSQKLKGQQKIIAGFLEQMYATVVECVHRRDGLVDKFMGDGSLCLFGALEGTPENSPLLPIAAVQASLDIRERCRPLLEDLANQAQSAGKMPRPQLSLGIGIHRAEELVGIIQTKNRDQFTAVGHGVNLAQRFEGVAGKVKGKHRYGDILISQEVQKHVKNHFELKEEPALEDLRNIRERHRCWTVVQRRSNR